MARWLLRVLRRVRVTGESMEPTLSPGTTVLVNMRAYRDVGPAVGDVVVANHPQSGIEIIKRVESVDDGEIRIRSDNSDTLEVSDSRIFGPIASDQITGKVVAQIEP